MNEDKFQQDAIQILDRLTLMPFEERFTLDKTLCELPKCAEIYAVRHRREGILYIGKSLTIRNRFMGSHKANMRSKRVIRLKQFWKWPLFPFSI